MLAVFDALNREEQELYVAAFNESGGMFAAKMGKPKVRYDPVTGERLVERGKPVINILREAEPHEIPEDINLMR